MHRRILAPVLIAGATLSLTGCPPAPGPGVGTSSATTTGELLGAGGSSVGIATAPYIVVTLATGVYETRADVADLATNAAYKSSQMVFRRVTGTGTDFFLGVFEVTQGQWTAMGGSGTPWTTLPSSLTNTNAVDKPAMALSWFAIDTAMTTFNGRGPSRFLLPTAVQWLAAAGAGPYAWGSATDSATVTAHAAVNETQLGTTGPRVVGKLSANANGFYDLTGNVWEWMADGKQVRGGSWYDGLSAARVSNAPGSTQGVVASVDHAVIGARLVLIP